MKSWKTTPSTMKNIYEYSMIEFRDFKILKLLIEPRQAT